MEEKRADIETRRKTERSAAREAKAARAVVARTRLAQRAIATARVKARKTPSIKSESRYGKAGTCYRLLCFRESHGLPGDSGR